MRINNQVRIQKERKELEETILKQRIEKSKTCALGPAALALSPPPCPAQLLKRS